MSSTALTANTDPAPRAVASLTGGMVAAIVPQTFDDVYRFAQVVAQSGLCPYGMDTPQKVTVAILTGLEIGVKPMQAVQGIAVIGGRPCVWGDLALGVVRGSGELEWIKEFYEGDLDSVDWTATKPDGAALKVKAVCVVKRKGEPETRNEFSIGDAVVAKLWGKRGNNGKDTPWITNPKRMLKMRARGFGLRDQFTDVMKGLYIAEELIGTDVDQPERSGPAAPPPPPAQPERPALAPQPPANANTGPAAPPAEEVEDAEIVEEPSPAVEGASEQHPPMAQEDAFDVEAWLDEARERFQEARTEADVDDVFDMFEATSNDLPTIEAQKFEDMHVAALTRVRAQGQPEQAEVTGEPGPAPGVRYFIHPESGSYFTTTDGSDGKNDPLVEECSAEEYEAFKERFDSVTAAPQGEEQDDDEDDSIDDSDFPGNDAIAAAPPPPKKTDGELYVERIRNALADPIRTFASVATLWNSTKEERAALKAKGEITKEQSKELETAIKARKAADAAPADKGPAAPPPESEVEAMDRTFRADLEACKTTEDVAALVANTMVARNKFSDTPQHKAWTEAVKQRRKQLAGVA